MPDLPRTNNDLEQFFGTYRYHDRRTTGRKQLPGLVLNGSVCVIAAAATRLHTYSAAELAPENVNAWQELRQARRLAVSNGPCVGASAVIQYRILRSLRRTYSS